MRRTPVEGERDDIPGAAMKCKPALEPDGDGDGSIMVVVKGPKSVEINNSLYVRCD